MELKLLKNNMRWLVTECEDGNFDIIPEGGGFGYKVKRQHFDDQIKPFIVVDFPKIERVQGFAYFDEAICWPCIVDITERMMGWNVPHFEKDVLLAIIEHGEYCIKKETDTEIHCGYVTDPGNDEDQVAHKSEETGLWYFDCWCWYTERLVDLITVKGLAFTDIFGQLMVCPLDNKGQLKIDADNTVLWCEIGILNEHNTDNILSYFEPIKRYLKEQEGFQ